MQVSEKIENCRICESSKLVNVLHLGDQPPANSLRKNRDETLPNIPLKLVFCENCSTVQLSDTVNPNFLFAEISNLSSNKPTQKISKLDEKKNYKFKFILK